MKVSIIHGGSTRGKDMFQGEVWTCNNIYDGIYWAGGYVNKLFIMHKQVYVDGEPVFLWDHIDLFSKTHGFEVLALHDIPCKHTKYPYEEIANWFDTDYFTDSTCYEIAYAMYHDYERIEFYGVEFVHAPSEETDGLNERLGVEYWLGRAHQRGIETVIHKGYKPSQLLTTSTGKPYAIDG
jgi:hypothetical protein